QRLVSIENLAPAHDRSTRFTDRLAWVDKMLPVEKRLLALYGRGARENEASTELLAVGAFVIHIASAAWDITDDITPSLDSSQPAYASRMAAIDRMRVGTEEQILGVLLIAERAPSRRDVAPFADKIREEIADLGRHLSPRARARIREVVAGQVRRERDPSAH